MRNLASVFILAVLFLARDLVASEPSTANASIPDASFIISRLIERAGLTNAPSSIVHFCCCRRTLVEEFDEHGRVKIIHTKDHFVDSRGGEERVVLQKVDDRNPTPRDLRMDRKEHPDASPNGKDHGKSGTHDESAEIDARLIKHFRYELLGTNVVGGRPAFHLSFEPRADDKVLPREDQIVGLMRGTVWIDAADYEVVKIDARLCESVEMLGGIVGALRKLSVVIERRRLSGNFWENAEIDTRFEIRKFFAVTRGHFQLQQDRFELLPD
jgi:hypothetical protein